MSLDRRYWSVLPVELKYLILSNLSYDDISFIENDYFWMNYCKKYNVCKQYSQFDWKSNYTLHHIFGKNKCEHITSLYGSRIYFGQIEDEWQVPEYVSYKGNHKYQWFHIFLIYKEYGNGRPLFCCDCSYCTVHYFVYRSDFVNTLGSDIRLETLHDMYLYTYDNIKLYHDKSINLFDKMNDLFNDVYDLNFISTLKYVPKKDNNFIKPNKYCSLFYKHNVPVGVVSPYFCDCTYLRINNNDDRES